MVAIAFGFGNYDDTNKLINHIPEDIVFYASAHLEGRSDWVQESQLFAEGNGTARNMKLLTLKISDKINFYTATTVRNEREWVLVAVGCCWSFIVQ